MSKNIKQRLINLIVVCGFLLCVAIFVVGSLGYTKSIANDLKYIVSNQTIENLNGKGTLNDPYHVRCAKEFIYLVNGANTEEDYLKGKYVLLDNNILILPFMNSRIVNEDSEASFAGCLDGGNHTIAGLRISFDAEYVGTFSAVTGTVKNLSLAISKFKGTNVGAITGVLGIDGLIKNVSIAGSVKTYGDASGALVGVNYGRVINCVANSEFVGESGDVNEVPDFLADGKSTRFMTYPEPTVETIADDFESAYANISLNVDTDRIGGFYNYLDDTWCFVRPDCDSRWELCFEGKDSKYTIEFEDGIENGQFEYNENIYNIKLCEYSDCPSLFLSTVAQNGRQYIYEDKSNSIAATALCLDENVDLIDSFQISSITGRGNDSFQNDLDWKNGFSFSLNERKSVFGLEDNDDYLLLPGYRYSSLLSYAIEKDLFSEVNTRFAPEYRLVQFYINDEYMGLYMLTDSMEIDPNRFDLVNSYKDTQNCNQYKLSEYDKIIEQDEEGNATKVYYDIPNNPKDLTGGYLVEIDLKDYPDSRSRFISPMGAPIAMKSNNYASKEQLEYVYDFWKDFEEAVISADGINTKGKHYTDYIDIDSMADLSLQLEMSCDISFLGSIYFYKDSERTGDGKLHAANHWDLERSYSDIKLAGKNSFIMDARYDKFVNNGLEFWPALYSHEEFREALKEKWFNSYKPAVEKILAEDVLENEKGVGSINYYIDRYEESAKINGNRWPGCAWQEKGERIREFLVIRSDLLNSEEFWENCLEHEE